MDSTATDYGPSSGVTIHCPTMGMTFPWKKIWTLVVPNKVKHFAWRLALNNLPLKRKIESRGMEIDARCLMWLRFDEDGDHLFLNASMHGRFGVT